MNLLYFSGVLSVLLASSVVLATSNILQVLFINFFKYQKQYNNKN